MHNGRIYNVQGNYDPRQIITGMLEHASERQMEREEGIFEVTRQWVEVRAYILFLPIPLL